MYSCYIKKSKSLVNRKKILMYYNELSVSELEILEKNEGCEDDYSHLNLMFLEKVLTNNEYDIIKLHFFYGYSISEIAKVKKIARQNVNKAKIQALKKIEKYLGINR